MFKSILTAALAGITLFAGSVFTPAVAQSQSEAACNGGDAEACFYTGAEYAQGSGVAEDKQKAVTFFLKACDMGIPDGCSTSGYLTSRGEGNIVEDDVKATTYYERACKMGHEDGCNWGLGALLAQSPRDAARIKTLIVEGCNAGSTYACKWGAGALFDGSENKYPELIDHELGGPVAEKSCEIDWQAYGCYFAEVIYGNPDAPTFNAEKSLTYTNIGCSFDQAQSCSNLGGIYVSIEDYDFALRSYEKACTLGLEASCDYAKSLSGWMEEVAAYEQRMAEMNATMNSLIGSGAYGQAVNTAIYTYGSTDMVAKAVTAASNAGRMSDISTQDLYVVAYWFPSGPVRGAADREMAARGTGLEGTFGEGTNTAGAADARYRAQYGSSMPSSSSSSYSSSSPSKPVLSAAEASAQTKARYRTAHCTMNGNPDWPVCR
ncbi:sel1 repeat family protein [Parvularcula flava]|uniref:Sel1 repeat family protein n=1 Tax=Aquisalinus luteolus TaxID=1566827 RepID=A0A8J3A968_9PROT|nr:tetratricopeptide repeat protein [Aquisalinus luteolus]NHK28859.1 sel1 repeat family protein [Aquisalinus luteolus]GGH99733.1 hypothetical protein GCM10011355_26390 [Aquisalinus luteolus]